MMTTRSVRLVGTLTGRIWMPAIEAQLPVEADLIAEAARDVSGSGMVEAIRSLVECAGDFRSARLTADSYVSIRHGRAVGNRWITSERLVELAALPSLSDYVASETFTDYAE